MKKATPALPTSSHLRKKNGHQEGYQNQIGFASDQTLLLTVKQAAALLNLSVATVYRLIQTEEIPSVLIRGSRRLSREALQQWVREQ